MSEFNLANLNDDEKKELERLMNKAAQPDDDLDPEDLDLDEERRAIATATHLEPAQLNHDDWLSGEAPLPNPGSPQVSRLPSAEEMATKWKNNAMATGRTNYLKGIRRPKKSPIAASIAAEGKYAEGVRKAVEEKRRAKALQTVTDDEWLAACEEIGAARYNDGIEKKSHKMARFMASYKPALEAHLAKIDAMPQDSEAEREARMLENLRGMRKLKGVHRK